MVPTSMTGSSAESGRLVAATVVLVAFLALLPGAALAAGGPGTPPCREAGASCADCHGLTPPRFLAEQASPASPVGDGGLPRVPLGPGWMMTELGRIPWIVYGLMKIDQGVTPIVSSGHVLRSLLGDTLVYGALMVAMIYLMIKFVKAGPDSSQTVSSDVPDAMPSLVGAQD